MLVGLYITGAYWFIAWTSFANAVVLNARGLTNSFTGIAPGSIPLFVAAQLAATGAACLTLPWLHAVGGLSFPLSFRENVGWLNSR
jgi:hypothetical protein